MNQKQIEFNTRGNEKQLQCAKYWIDNETIDIVYGGSKGSAKSFTGCSLVFGDALIYPETHYFIARKTLTDLRKYTIPSIHEVLTGWKLGQEYYKYNGKDNYFQLYNGSKVFLIDAKYLPSDPNYMRFGSMQMTRGWIEEAGEFEEECKNNLQASIGRWKNTEYNLTPKLLQTCNPAKNYLYRSYYKLSKDNALESHKKFIQALPSDNKCLPPDYIPNLLKILSKNEIERLVYGNWEYDDDPACLIDYDSISDYFNPTHIIPQGNKYLTIDVARKGRDKTVFRVWHGWLCIARYEILKSGIDEVVRQAKVIQQNNGVSNSHTIADEDGVGGGVVDYLKCKGFINNSKPLNDENYDNLKSQCTFIAAKKITDRLAGEICKDSLVKDRTSEEMEQVKQKNIESDGKLGIIDKKKISELIGRSPDDWDSIMMRAYFDLKPPLKARSSSTF